VTEQEKKKNESNQDNTLDEAKTRRSEQQHHHRRRHKAERNFNLDSSLKRGSAAIGPLTISGPEERKEFKSGKRPLILRVLS